jgi:wyosine [tRNA(Phe)-imidazoG37] synthetase (radical SAM superfamily)
MCQGSSIFHSGESAGTFSNPDGTASLYPEYVKFCHDKTCNLHCITCRDDVIGNTAEKTEALDALIETHFLPLLKDAKTVALNGDGELFASKHCRRLVKEIAERYPHIKFAICSNGVMCDEKNCAELGILDRIVSVQISVNAAIKETYDKIMLGGSFDRVRRNIEWLSGLKKEGKIDFLRLVFVVSSINYREMKPFMEWAIELDAIVDFWEYRPWGNAMAKDYALYAVFNPKHKEYRKLARILKDDVFKHPNCCMDGELRGVDISKTGLRYFISRAVKKVNRKIGNTKQQHTRNKIDRIKFSFDYYPFLLKEISNTYSFKGKDVLEIGADLNLECIKAVLTLGARHGYAANPRISSNKKTGKKITVVKDLAENSGMDNESVDLIYGFGLLEHVANPGALAKEVARLLRRGGHAYLQGNPMWTSPKGHHVYIRIGETNYSFDESNGPSPVEDWYHLTNPVYEDFEQKLKGNNVPAAHIPELYNWIFKDPHASRLTPTQIIEAFQSVNDIEVIYIRQLVDSEEYKQYRLENSYSVEDLRTCGLTFHITKK